jgi:hypothetical protein
MRRLDTATPAAGYAFPRALAAKRRMRSGRCSHDGTELLAQVHVCGADDERDDRRAAVNRLVHAAVRHQQAQHVRLVGPRDRGECAVVERVLFRVPGVGDPDSGAARVVGE